MLHGMDNFIIMAGTTAATLIGLLFVAITIGVGLSSPNSKHGTHAFLTPTLILFGNVLLQCMAVLFPWSSAWPVGIIMGLCGLAGLARQIHLIRKQRKVDNASLDWLDWALFSTVPALGYASLIAGAAGLIAEKSFAPYAIAGAITLLLFAGIYGTWDLTFGSPGTRTRPNDADAICEFAPMRSEG
jgi:hypothetical protein